VLDVVFGEQLVSNFDMTCIDDAAPEIEDQALVAREDGIIAGEERKRIGMTHDGHGLARDGRLASLRYCHGHGSAARERPCKHANTTPGALRAENHHCQCERIAMVKIVQPIRPLSSGARHAMRAHFIEPILAVN
jgi:hypothetical protein